MVKVGQWVVTEQAVAKASEVGWLSLRWEALKQETVAAFEFFNLVGQTWTGKVQVVTS